jgi:hypothetical protein
MFKTKLELDDQAIDRMLDKEIKTLELELKQLKRARRARRAKAQTRFALRQDLSYM